MCYCISHIADVHCPRAADSLACDPDLNISHRRGVQRPAWHPRALQRPLQAGEACRSRTILTEMSRPGGIPALLFPGCLRLRSFTPEIRVVAQHLEFSVRWNQRLLKADTPDALHALREDVDCYSRSMAEAMLKVMNPINPVIWDLVSWPESPAEHDAPKIESSQSTLILGSGRRTCWGRMRRARV